MDLGWMDIFGIAQILSKNEAMKQEKQKVAINPTALELQFSMH